MTEEAALRGQRVMVVEDEFLVAMLIEDLLADEGCTVVGPFNTVGDALQAAIHVDVDVAVLDVNLRGEKVYPVAEALDHRGIPFVLLSGYGEEAIPQDRPSWRACSKPFDARALLKLLTVQLFGAPRPN